MEWGWLTALVSGPYLVAGRAGVWVWNHASSCLCAWSRFQNNPKQPIADVNMIDIALGTTVWVRLLVPSPLRLHTLAAARGQSQTADFRAVVSNHCVHVCYFHLALWLAMFLLLYTVLVAKQCQWGCVKLLSQVNGIIWPTFIYAVFWYDEYCDSDGCEVLWKLTTHCRMKRAALSPPNIQRPCSSPPETEHAS